MYTINAVGEDFLEPKERAANEMTTQLHPNSGMDLMPKITTLKGF